MDGELGAPTETSADPGAQVVVEGVEPAVPMAPAVPVAPAVSEVAAGTANDLRAWSRDRHAMLTQLMQAYGEAVYGFCLRVVCVPALAEDLRQKVFQQAYRDLDQFEGRSSPRAWLFGIAYHRCLDAIRADRRYHNLIDDDEQAVLAFEDKGPGPEDRIDSARRVVALEGCLQRLAPDVRMTVLLRFQTDATYDELSGLLGATSETLQMRVARSLRRLRRCLERKGWTGE